VTVRATPQTCFVAPLIFDVYGVRAYCGDGYADPDRGEQCDDGNTEDGDCCSSTCQVENDGLACASDGNSCTDDQCLAGSCHHANNSAPCASDGNACTDDQCLSGTCRHLSNSAMCDDGDACTTNDHCAGGLCTGTPSCLLDH